MSEKVAAAEPAVAPPASELAPAVAPPSTLGLGLNAEHILSLQKTAGNRAVCRALADGMAPVAPQEAQMDADVEFIAARLKEQVLDAAEEQAIVDRIRQWAEAGATAQAHGFGQPGDAERTFDRFLLKLKLRNVTRATARSAFMDTTVNVFDTLFHELEDTRLSEFRRLLAKSKRYANAGPESGPSENAWATVGRQELIGMFGMMKGLSTGLAGLGDVAIWAMVKQANMFLSPLGTQIKDPAKLADMVGKNLDVSGDYLFDGEFTGGQELFLGQNAASVGTAGGSIIWNLVMLGQGAPQGGMKALDLAGKFKAVDESLTSLGDYLLRMKEKGKLDGAHLLADDEFKVECFKVAGAIVGAISGGLGMRGEASKATVAILERVATVFKAGEMGAKVGQIAQILMDDKLEPKAQRAAVGKLLMDLVADAFGLVGAKAAEADEANANAKAKANGTPLAEAMTSAGGAADGQAGTAAESAQQAAGGTEAAAAAPAGAGEQPAPLETLLPPTPAHSADPEVEAAFSTWETPAGGPHEEPVTGATANQGPLDAEEMYHQIVIPTRTEGESHLAGPATQAVGVGAHDTVRERLATAKADVAAAEAALKADPANQSLEDALKSKRHEHEQLNNQLLVSTFKSLDEQTPGSKKALGGTLDVRGRNTVAAIQIISAQGELIGVSVGSYQGGKDHAETQALKAFEHEITPTRPGDTKQAQGQKPPSRIDPAKLVNATMHVVGDQYVCPDVCRPALKDFAAKYKLAGIEAQVLTRPKLVGAGDATPKTTATTALKSGPAPVPQTPEKIL